MCMCVCDVGVLWRNAWTGCGGFWSWSWRGWTRDICLAPFRENSPLKRSEWHVLTRDHTVSSYLPPTRLSTNGMSHTTAEHSTRRASPHFGRYAFPVPQRVGGWVGLGGWLHTEMVWPPEDGHPSQYQCGGRGSNSRSLGRKSDALTTRLRSHVPPPRIAKEDRHFLANVLRYVRYMLWAVRLSVCLSVVCLSSVCLWRWCTLLRWLNFSAIFSPYDSSGTLLFCCQKSLVGDAPFPLKFAFKVTHPL